MIRRLEGKVAFITGAARGIGKAFAKTYIAEGAKVVIGDINDEQMRKTVSGFGEEAFGVYLDVASEESIKLAVNTAINHFGQIDILINNAALFSAAPITEINKEDFSRVFEINVSGTLFTMKAVAQHMIERGIKGKIINMASCSGTIKLDTF